MNIPIFLNYGRSGGTLINQCLGALPKTVIISEVNHLGGGWGIKKADSPMTVWDQAREWYKIDLASRDFVESIKELRNYCESNDLRLIHRDWVYPFYSRLKGDSPSYKMETIELLKPNLAIQPFVFVRNAIDMWISFGMPDPDPFFEDYHRFINEIQAKGYPIFKYEDFCENPQGTMKEVTDILGLNFDKSFEDKYHLVNANGNTQSKNSRGILAKKITLLPRKTSPYDRVKEINNSEIMKACNHLLNYSVNYFDSNNLKTNYWFNNIKMKLSGI